MGKDATDDRARRFRESREKPAARLVPKRQERDVEGNGAGEELVPSTGDEDQMSATERLNPSRHRQGEVNRDIHGRSCYRRGHDRAGVDGRTITVVPFGVRVVSRSASETVIVKHT